MAETLGYLCDKLTIIKLKQWHSTDPERLSALEKQQQQLQDEIDEFLRSAISGATPLERLTFTAHKVYKKEGNEVPPVLGNIGEVFARLATVNCELWHEQEKVYQFEQVPHDQKDKVVKRLALLNLERNQCIDRIDQQFAGVVTMVTNSAR